MKDIFTEGIEPPCLNRRRFIRPMCIPFHEVNLSVTIEFFESREGLEPSSVSTYSVLQTGSLPFGHLDIFLFNKMSKNYIVGEEGLEPPVSKRAMLQTARLPITGYSPILKKLIYEVQTVRTFI